MTEPTKPLPIYNNGSPNSPLEWELHRIVQALSKFPLMIDRARDILKTDLLNVQQGGEPAEMGASLKIHAPNGDKIFGGSGSGGGEH